MCLLILASLWSSRALLMSCCTRSNQTLNPAQHLFIKTFFSACVLAIAEDHVRPVAIASAIDLLAQFAVMTCTLATPSAGVCNIQMALSCPQYMHRMS